MSENHSIKPPELQEKISLPFITGSVAVMLVMIALPVSQMVSGTPKEPPQDIDSIYDQRPSEVEPKKIEEIKPEKPVIKDLDEEVPPPSLTDLEFMNNPDVSIYGNPDYRVVVNGMGDGLEETLHTLDELTKPPRPIRQPEPLYPNELKVAGIEGEVVLTFIVQADGKTSRIKAISSTNPGFEKPAMRSVRRWIFQPGEKDGKVVNTIVRIQIPFRINSPL